jgi:hypothetical protein
MSHSLRTVLTIAAGSMVLFVWGALSHLIIIRGVGFTALPDDGTLAHALVGDHVEPGLYVFPAPPGWRGEPTTKTSMAAWDARFREGPSGLIVIRPRGEGPFGARKLLVQLLADVIAVSLALLVVRSIRASFWLRVTCVAALGVGGFVTVGRRRLRDGRRDLLELVRVHGCLHRRAGLRHARRLVVGWLHAGCARWFASPVAMHSADRGDRCLLRP